MSTNNEDRKAGEQENRPTPETDAAMFYSDNGGWVVGVAKSKTLERQRDVARENTKAWHGEYRALNDLHRELGLEHKKALRQLDEALAHLGTKTGHDCVICGQAIFGTLIGAGDGTGQQFAHPACHYRRQLESAHRERSDAEEERLRLEQELARVILQRQRLWEALADALEHVPSTLQGRARFALAEVKDAAS